jgi:hypothetical protein
MKPIFSRPICALLLFLLGALSAGVSGCATTDSENLSARPWNSPQGWETGAIPSSMNEGH